MQKLTINGIDVTVEDGTTVLQACETLGIEIPIFCYHPKLSIAGNCRMCLVEVESSSKPVASCSMPATNGMVVKTNTPLITHAREGVLELLLINHPLDCPICDQGGECDLQDITLKYGRGQSRFSLNKRAVKDKTMGPLIKPIMTRCIHCTRCIRFANEIAGVPEMAALGRGENMEITTYLGKALTSELSGNMIDICPVGALTNKPYAFHGRPWELTKTETIDVFDAVGSNIRVDSVGREIMRILPRLNEEINEEWISDKTRFAYDGLKQQRLDQPYIRQNGKLIPTTWENAFTFIKKNLDSLSGKEIAALAGDQADCESMMALKDLMISLESPHLDCRQDGTHWDNRNRSAYIFNTTIAGIEKADLILLIVTNPRYEAPLINARIRKRYLKSGLTHKLEIGMIGPKSDLTYPYEHLGEYAKTIREIIDGKHPFCKKLKAAKKPVLILGQGAMNRRDSLEILYLCQKISEEYNFIQKDWNGFNVLHTAAARVGGLDLGFLPQKGGLDTAGILGAAHNGKIKALYLLGADEIPMNELGNTFVIYQGHHGDKGAHRADVILPGAAYTEKSATYVNTEGRPQRTTQAILPPGQAKEDWRIIRALSEVLGHSLPYATGEDIQRRLIEVNIHFKNIDKITPSPWEIIPLGTPETLSQLAFQLPITNFYCTDPISRHSTTMAHCTALLPKQEQKEQYE
ncbi:MAG: NADH-quinone oxidoreductase subunit G [Alphaproteobacteria bacterium]|nr:NADH-quinone oxidoreductase subunit G [Alphaproteobacteria bacterium]